MSNNHGGMRQAHFYLFLIWLIPGAALAYFLRHSLPMTNFMSWYAIVVAHAVGWASGRAEDAANNGEESKETT